MNIAIIILALALAFYFTMLGIDTFYSAMWNRLNCLQQKYNHNNLIRKKTENILSNVGNIGGTINQTVNK